MRTYPIARKNRGLKMKRNLLLYIIVGLIFLSINVSLNGQTKQLKSIEFTSPNINNQFKFNAINCIYEDSEGFMWIGTSNGLYKYNGMDATLFKHIPGDTSTISNNTIRDIIEDENGNIWITTTYGINRYNKKTEKFYWYTHDPGDSTSLSHNRTVRFLKTSDNDFLVGTNLGIDVLDISTKNKIKTKNYRPNRRLTDTESEWSIQCLFEDSKKNIWAGTWGGGLIYFDKTTGEFTHYYPETNYSSINDYVISAIEQINDSIIWACSYTGKIYPFNVLRKHFINDPNSKFQLNLPEKKITTVYDIKKDRNGNIWLATSKGLKLYDIEKRRYLLDGIPVNKNEPDKIKDQASCIYEDSNGSIWVGYLSEGIDIYHPNSPSFNKWHYNIKSSDRYRDYLTDFLQDNDGNFWFATWGDGLLHCSSDGKVLQRILPSNITKNLSSDIIKDIIYDIKGNIWMATHHGLFSLDVSQKKINNVFLHDPNDSISLPENHISNLYQDNDGFLWVITQENLRFLNPVKQKLRKFPATEKITKKKITTVFKDNKNNYWFGTFNGLYKFDTKDSILINYKTDPVKPNTIISNELYTIFQDSKNALWIGTNNGLSIMDTESESFKTLDGSKQLNNRINHIIEYNDQDYWILSITGLINYHLKNNYFKSFLKGDVISRFSNYMDIDKTGKIVILEEKGFYRLPVDSLSGNNSPAPVYITGLFINGEKVRSQEDPLSGTSVTYKKQIRLKYSQNNFSFTFAALDYINPENISYKYKLEGFSNEWVSLGSNHQVSFMNLREGNYVFSVKSSNDSETWDEKSAQIIIKVLPPPWKTWWAYMIYMIVLLSMFVLYRLYTISKQEEKSLVLLEQMKLSFFINISHELRTPLTLITAPLEKMLEKGKSHFDKEKLQLVHRNASRLQHLVNQILDIRKIDVGKLKPVVSLFDLILFTDTILASFKSYADDHEIDFEVITSINHKKYWFDPDMVEKVLSNLLINAFKHTNKEGKVTFILKQHKKAEMKSVFDHMVKTMHRVKISKNKNVQLFDEYVQFEISDTGEGIHISDLNKVFERFYQNISGKRSSSIGSGIGLSLSKNLVELMHGHLFVESGPQAGTRFIVLLPVSQDAYRHDIRQEETGVYEFVQKDYTKSIAPVSKAYAAKVNDAKDSDNNKDLPTILLVDDNMELLDFMEDILSDNYMVCKATNALSGLELAMDENIDLIISDVMMPEMDGFELCKKIKTDVNTSHIPVVLLTAKSSLDSESEGLEMGADAFITKPFNADLLLKRIQNIIDTRRKLWRKIASDSSIIPEGVELSNKDEEFFENAVEIVNKYISDASFSQMTFSQEIGMSRASLYRKLKKLTNQSINIFIRNIRLKKAAEILRYEKDIRIAELSFRVGFSDPSYFTKKFREYFELTPKEYAQKNFVNLDDGQKQGQGMP